MSIQDVVKHATSFRQKQIKLEIMALKKSLKQINNRIYAGENLDLDCLLLQDRISQIKDRLFGSEKSTCNPIVWICNFMKYKAHLIACDSKVHDLSVLFAVEATQFAPLYSILQNIDWFSVL